MGLLIEIAFLAPMGYNWLNLGIFILFNVTHRFLPSINERAWGIPPFGFGTNRFCLFKVKAWKYNRCGFMVIRKISAGFFFFFKMAGVII